MVIRNNLPAMNAERQNGLIGNAFTDKSEKLSSGYRINRSADDASGLAISEKMRRQVRGLTQASANAQEGVSYIQTAEGALNEVHDLLQRGNELCVKAANDSNTAKDREYIQEEINQIRAEIDRIAMDTSFNEMQIFDSTNAGSRNAQVTPWRTVLGGELPDAMHFGLDYAAAEAAAQAGGKTAITADILEAFANKLKDTYLPQVMNHIQAALPVAQPPFAGLEIGLSYYYENSGTIAYVATNGVSFQLCFNMNYFQVENGAIKLTDQLAGTVAHEMTHAVMGDLVTNGMMGTDGANQLPNWFIEGAAQAVGGAANYVSDILNAAKAGNDAEVKNGLQGLTNGGYASYSQGYLGTMYLGYICSGQTSVTSAGIANGINKVLEHIADGYSMSQAISILSNGKYTDLSDFEKSFADDAIPFVKELANAIGNDYSTGRGSISFSSLSDTQTQFFTGAASTGDDYFLLNIDPGGRIDNTSKYNAAGHNPYTGGGATTTNGTDADGNVNPNAATNWGTGSSGNAGGSGGSGGSGGGASYSSGNVSFVQVGAESGQHIDISRYKLSAKDLGVDAVDVSDADSAGSGIESYKAAIESISDIRADYGATQNRLEHTINNLDNVVENVTASESRIRDTDMAKMMAGYTNDRILLQASQAIMAQANRMNQVVLALLG